MSILESRLNPPPGRTITANLSCFTAMVMWAVGFPVAELLMQSWGVIALASVRQLLAVAALLFVWILADGWDRVLAAPWWRGFGVGGIGFGFGAALLLVGQQMSDPVTPAIAAAGVMVAQTARQK